MKNYVAKVDIHRFRQETSGFTLIELLVVIAIIGVLAAIAIPQFASYKARGFDSRALHDLRTGASAEEALYATNLQYITCATAAACQAALPGFRPSAGVTISFTRVVAAGAVPEHFTGSSTHPNGTGVTCLWDSDGGGSLGCS